MTDVTVADVEKRLMEFRGFGREMPGLVIHEFYDRELTRFIDPEYIRPKIDIHKSIMMFNTNAEIPKHHNPISRDSLNRLKDEYWEAAQFEGVLMRIFR